MCRCKIAHNSLNVLTGGLHVSPFFPWRALLCVQQDKDSELGVATTKSRKHTKNKNDKKISSRIYGMSVFPSLFRIQAQAAIKSVILLLYLVCRVGCDAISYDITCELTVAGAHVAWHFTIVYRELQWRKAELNREWAIHVKCKYYTYILQKEVLPHGNSWMDL